MLKEQLLSSQLKEIRVVGVEFSEKTGSNVDQMKDAFKHIDLLEEKRMEQDLMQDNIRLLQSL